MMTKPQKFFSRCTRRKAITTAALLAALTGSASAQFMPKMSLGGDKPPMTPEEKEKQQQLDNAYKSATSKIPDQAAPVNDPWATVRPAPTASASAQKKKPQQ